MKKLQFIQRSRGRHWVGDGFPVRSIFTYNEVAEKMSPFLLLDYAGPHTFPPTDQRKGVGAHPHRGFETVTIVYEGEVEHKDSSGGGGKIGPGEVQWMTAASGIIHEEFHGRGYAKKGGPFEMVQLWVNLPKKNKMDRPGYQGLTRDQIKEVALPDDTGVLRVIAGEYGEVKGPARTATPMGVWDVRLNAGTRADFEVKDGHTAAIFVLKGQIKIHDGQTVAEAELAVLERDGTRFEVEAGSAGAKFLILTGQPLNEPIVGHGPFVMNTEEEIHQAFEDYQRGTFLAT